MTLTLRMRLAAISTIEYGVVKNVGFGGCAARPWIARASTTVKNRGILRG